jgi:serine/threonine protein kinase
VGRGQPGCPTGRWRIVMESLGKYKILKELGRGGMGVVYLAHDPIIGRDVAIKVIHEEALQDKKAKQRFYREARSAGRLSHENIMTLYDVAEDVGSPYLVMELLGGLDLKQILAERRPLTLANKLEIAVQICRGLHYAHSQSVVHRDIKPGNVRILDDGRVKIVDFGIAHIDSDDFTATQSSLGTPRYMSPEQVRGESVDGRSDIFSFGVLFYEMLTGDNPFSGETVTSVIYKVLNLDPEPPEIGESHVSKEIKSLVARCLAKDREKRSESFAEVTRSLESIIDQMGNLDTVVSPKPPVTEWGTGLEPTPEKDGAERKPPAQAPAAVTAASPAAVPVSPRPSKGSLRRIWLGAALLVAVLSVGYILYFPRRDGGIGETGSRPVATDPDGLMVSADAVLGQVLTARQAIAGKVLPSGLETLFVEARALEDSAGRQIDAASFAQAIPNLKRAAPLYEQVKDSLDSLGGQLRQAKKAMEEARAQVTNPEHPSIRDDFARVGTEVERADALLDSGEYAQAMSLFNAARIKYDGMAATLIGSGEPGSAGRDSERDRPNQGLPDPIHLAAKRSAERAQIQVKPYAGDACLKETIATAQQDWDRGERLASENKPDEAALQFRAAQGQYEGAMEIHRKQSEAEQARDAANQNRERALARRGQPDAAAPFEEAERLRNEGLSQFANCDLAAATASFQAAQTRYGIVADLPEPPEKVDVVALVHEAADDLMQRLRAAMMSGDWTGLPDVIKSYYGRQQRTLSDKHEILDVELTRKDIQVGYAAPDLLVNLFVTIRQKGRDAEDSVRITKIWKWSVQEDQAHLTDLGDP